MIVRPKPAPSPELEQRGPDGEGESNPLEEICAISVDEGRGRGPAGLETKRKRPFGAVVVLSVLLALAAIGMVGYQVYSGVNRGPHWLPLPDAGTDAGADAD